MPSRCHPPYARRRASRKGPSLGGAPVAIPIEIKALALPTGLERLRQLADNFLRYVEGGLYPGGCFFSSVAAEMAGAPGSGA